MEDPQSNAARVSGSTAATEKNQAALVAMFDAFARHDAKSMLTAYADIATFEDPVFGKLDAPQIHKMWTALASGDSLKLTYTATATPEGGTVHWLADYVLNGHKVHNDVTSQIVMADGKIVTQHDSFDFAR